MRLALRHLVQVAFPAASQIGCRGRLWISPSARKCVYLMSSSQISTSTVEEWSAVPVRTAGQEISKRGFAISARRRCAANSREVSLLSYMTRRHPPHRGARRHLYAKWPSPPKVRFILPLHFGHGGAACAIPRPTRNDAARSPSGGSTWGLDWSTSRRRSKRSLRVLARLVPCLPIRAERTRARAMARKQSGFGDFGPDGRNALLPARRRLSQEPVAVGRPS